MAQKRMFSLQIVDTDAFLDMPISTQLLYFHLAMRADDEGFVSSPKRIMKVVGAGEDDLKVLVAKKFIIAFESGVCVIKHWLIHNTIRMDRFGGTTYIEERKQLIIKDNKAYKLVSLSQENEVATTRQPNGNQLVPQVKLSKDKISKVSKIPRAVEVAAQRSAADIELGKLVNKVLEGFKEVNPSYSRLYANKNQRKSLERLLKLHGQEKIEAVISYLPKSNANKFAPTITTPSQLEEKLGALLAWAQKQKDTTGKGKQIII